MRVTEPGARRIWQAATAMIDGLGVVRALLRAAEMRSSTYLLLRCSAWPRVRRCRSLRLGTRSVDRSEVAVSGHLQPHVLVSAPIDYAKSDLRLSALLQDRRYRASVVANTRE